MLPWGVWRSVFSLQLSLLRIRSSFPLRAMTIDQTLSERRKAVFYKALWSTLTLPMIVLLITPLVLGVMVARLTETVGWQRHSHEVLQQVSEIQKLMADMETSLRGFQTSHDQVFLEPYLRAEPRAASAVGKLHDLVRDNRAQSARIEQVTDAQRQWLAYAAKEIAAVTPSSAVAVDLTSLLEGKRLMDEFRDRIDSFKAAENDLLAERARTLADVQSNVMGERLALLGFVALIVIWWVHRQLRNLHTDYGELIEELVNQKAEIAAKEATFRVTFENAAVGIAHVSPDFRFLRVNHTLAVITGYPRDELVKKTFVDITPPEDLELDLAELLRLASGTIETYDMEKRYVRKDGTTIWVNLTVSAVRDANRRPAYYILIIEDITRRRTAEANLMQAQAKLQQHASQLEVAVAQRTAQLEDVVKELSTFSYSISHDLRAPLRTISGFAEVLTTDHAAELSSEGKEYLERIGRAAGRMDTLITDVLAYSRMSRAELRLEPIDPEPLIREALEAPRFSRPDATFHVEGPFPLIMASQIALQQCLTNLIGNAMKFSRPGVPPVVTIRAENLGERVRIYVDDNGIGIPAEHSEKVWGIFERLNPRYEGNGLGLAIVRRAVERMGGRVGLEGKPDQGSRFWIELPRPDLSTGAEPQLSVSALVRVS